MSGWQPIDTAPMNGTRVYVSNGRALVVAHWRPASATSGEGCVDAWRETAGWVDDDGNRLDPPPTHWQPAPTTQTQPPGSKAVDT